MRTLATTNSLVRLRIFQAAVVLPGLAALGQLAVFSWMGSYMRMSGDDYCYAASYRTNGILNGLLNSYSNGGPFNGNRYSLTLFSYLAEAAGPTANAILPGLAVILLTLGLFLTLRRVFKLTQNGQTGTLVAAALTLVTVFFILLLAPDIRQSLYWRSAMLPYFAPLIAGTFLAAVVLSFHRRKKIHALSLIGIFLLGVIGGGFSETGGVFLAACLGLAILLAGWASRKDSTRPGKALFKGLAAALAGVLIALIILAVSPSNSTRVDSLEGSKNLWEIAPLAFHSVRVFIAIRAQYLPMGIYLIIVFLMGALFLKGSSAHRLNVKNLIWGTIIISLAAAFTLWVTMLPFAIAQHSYPEQRALIIARFVINLAAGAIAWLFGTEIGRSMASRPAVNRLLSILGAMGLALGAAYILYSLPVTLGPHRLFRKWSDLWDQRNALLVEAASKNTESMDVIQLDHIIPDVGELSLDPGNWYNNCAEQYYGIKEIRAGLPGWDESE